MHTTAQHFKKLDASLERISGASSDQLGSIHSSNSSAIPTAQLKLLSEDWLADCQIRQQSERTIELRKMLLGRLEWFLNYRHAQVCGTSELRAFFAYLSTAHRHDGGRWGYGHKQHASRPMRPVTVRTYYAHLRSFFNWLVAEEMVEVSPLASLSPPQAQADQIQPFTREQVESLLQAARRASYPQRDQAILWFLFDTGVRASELCALKMKNVDLFVGRAQVLGKGNKHRTVCFGRRGHRFVREIVKITNKNRATLIRRCPGHPSVLPFPLDPPATPLECSVSDFLLP